MTIPQKRPQHQLQFWQLHEDDKRRKAGRLDAAGWVGITTTYYSDQERSRINEHLSNVPRHLWQFLNCEYFEEHDDWIGSMKDRQLGIWFRRSEDWYEFRAMLEAIPPRIHEFVIDPKKLTPDLKARLKGKNYTIITNMYDRNRCLLSIEDCNDAVILKMLCAP